MSRALYLDSSAIVKLIQIEPESDALRSRLGDRHLVSCALAHTEVLGAVKDRGQEVEQRAREMLSALVVVVDAQLLEEAARLDPRVLRTLDAIHVAAALAVQDDLDAVFTYDERMAHAAELVGLEVAAPGK